MEGGRSSLPGGHCSPAASRGLQQLRKIAPQCDAARAGLQGVGPLSIPNGRPRLPHRQDEAAFSPGELEAMYPDGHPGLYVG